MVFKVKGAPVADINFQRPRLVGSTTVPRTSAPSSAASVLPPSSEEITTFLSALSTSARTPAILSVVEPYCEQFISSEPDIATVPSSLPPCLTSVFRPFYRNLTYAELLTVAESVLSDTTVSSAEIVELEHKTREQYRCKLWHTQRVGRITASVFHTACHSNILRPARSFIRKICVSSYQKELTVPAIVWGKTHEIDAKEMYCQIMQQHQNHHVENCGLVLDCDLPFLGASPDGFIIDDCCGRGILECKCPFAAKDGTVSDVRYLHRTPDNELILDAKHPYYYQLQGQMHICKMQYADLVVWTTKECAVVRVQYDRDFCLAMCQKLTEVFKAVILPCLLTDDVNVHFRHSADEI